MPGEEVAVQRAHLAGEVVGKHPWDVIDDGVGRSALPTPQRAFDDLVVPRREGLDVERRDADRTAKELQETWFHSESPLGVMFWSAGAP